MYHFAGIWPEGADGTDINTCIRSHSAQYLVNGDDSGALNIFTYPCTKLKASLFLVFKPGHSYGLVRTSNFVGDFVLLTDANE
jgi:microtubule-associated protein-like 1/2